MSYQDFKKILDEQNPNEADLNKFVNHWLSNNVKMGVTKSIAVPKEALGKLIYKSDNNLIKNGILEQENEKLKEKLEISVEALKSMNIENFNENFESNYVIALNALEKLTALHKESNNVRDR